MAGFRNDGTLTLQWRTWFPDKITALEASEGMSLIQWDVSRAQLVVLRALRDGFSPTLQQIVDALVRRARQGGYIALDSVDYEAHVRQAVDELAGE